MTRDEQQAPIGFKFSGFLTPNYTQIPDQVFDELLPILSGNEIKVLMYICRRTFGFKKGSDNISLAQMVSGITSRDGTKLDGGTGLSKASVARALKDLEDKDIVMRVRRSDPQKGDLPTTYQLNVIDVRKLISRQEGGSSNSDTPRVSHRDTPVSHHATPRVSHRDTQETVLQETGTTTNYSSQNQSTHKEGDSSVVAQLVALGISQNVSQSLAVKFSPEYIREKIEHLAFLSATSKDSVKKPAAWLRRAIEDDFNAPDGFVSSAERERQANEENKRKNAILEAQKTQSLLIEQQQKEQEKQHAARIDQLYRKYGTSGSEIELWLSLQRLLLDKGFSPSLAASMYLLRLGESEAIVHVYNQFLLQQIAHSQTKQLIESTLASLIQRPIKLKLIVEQVQEGTGTTEPSD